MFIDKNSLTESDYEESRNYFIYEGCMAAGILSLTSGAFLTGYAKYIGISDVFNGIISAISAATGLIQLFSSMIFQKLENRKFLVVLSSFIFRLLLSIMFLMPLVFDLSSVDGEFEKWCNKICVYKKVNFYNPLITDYQNEIACRAKRDEEHRFHDKFRYSYGFDFQQKQSKIPFRKNKAVLSIDVSEKQVSRALRIMETFIKCINQLGGKVVVECGEVDNATFDVFDMNFSFKLTEVRVKRRSILGEDENKKRLRPMYEKVPNGMLEIEICELSNPKNLDNDSNMQKFIETINKPMDEQIGELFITIHKMAKVANQKQKIAEQEHRLELDEERRNREIQKEILTNAPTFTSQNIGMHTELLH